MSHLTIEKMDKINFLVTEVSLECLGNKFFDVYGKQNKSLLGLVSYNSLRQGPTIEDSETDLWQSLTVEKKKPIIRKQIQIVENHVPIEVKRKRRASFSTTNNEPDTSNDPESLLVPMNAPPKAAKISQRRSTISVQLAKNRKVTVPVTLPISRQQTQIQQIDGVRKKKAKTIFEIKQNLKKDTNMRKCFSLLLFHFDSQK